MKNRSHFAFCVFVCFSFCAGAVEVDRVGPALSSVAGATTFRATLTNGFHFNEAAPNRVEIGGKASKPDKSTLHELQFSFENADHKNGKAVLYVCDDALTFCEPRTVEIEAPKDADLNASAAGASVKTLSGPTRVAQATNSGDVAKGLLRKASTLKKNEFGFIEDDLPRAAALAAKENKLVLIDFSARWCPGCIRLENEIFGTPAFSAATKRFVTVRLDYDRFENLKVAKQFDIRAIPSLLVTNSKLDEISRLVDFQPMSMISSFLRDTQENSLPYREFQEKADANDKKAALMLGRRLYRSAQYSRSVEYLSRISPTPIELADAKVQAAKSAAKDNEKLKPQFQNALREAIEKEPSSSRSILWRTDLAELVVDAAEKKQVAAEGLVVVDRILDHPGAISQAVRGDALGEFTGFEGLYVASEGADLAEAANLDEKLQQAARLKVTAIGRALKIPVSLKGPALRYLIFLMAAKEFSEAETQVTAMLKVDAQNPELERRQLRILNGLKKFNEASSVGRKLLQRSFGKNEVWVAQQLIKSYLGLGEKLEAKALAQTYLERKDIEWNLMKSEQNDLMETVQL